MLWQRCCCSALEYVAVRYFTSLALTLHVTSFSMWHFTSLLVSDNFSRWGVQVLINCTPCAHSPGQSFIRVLWLIHTIAMTHSYVYHDSCICVAWLVDMDAICTKKNVTIIRKQSDPDPIISDIFTQKYVYMHIYVTYIRTKKTRDHHWEGKRHCPHGELQVHARDSVARVVERDCKHLQQRLYVCIYIYTYVCMYVTYVCIYICVCLYVDAVDATRLELVCDSVACVVERDYKHCNSFYMCVYIYMYVTCVYT